MPKKMRFMWEILDSPKQLIPGKADGVRRKIERLAPLALFLVWGTGGIWDIRYQIWEILLRQGFLLRPAYAGTTADFVGGQVGDGEGVVG
jgi:hypothetical protein